MIYYILSKSHPGIIGRFIVKERRYKKEYRIVTDADPKTGRPRDVAEYAGDYYRFPQGSPAPRQRALRLAAWHGLYWLCALAYLRTGRATGRCMYALVPFMIGLLPGAYGLMGLFALFRAPNRMTVVQRENGPGRLVRSALGYGAFSAAGALGCAVFLTVSRQWFAWHEPLLCAAASAAAWIAFAASRKSFNELKQE